MNQMNKDSVLPHIVWIADWQVDVATNRIRRGDDEFKLESRMMDLLVYLADRSGEVVSREAIERDIWNGRAVSYDALTVCMKKLRKTLGDDPRHPHYIETVAKKGYRLIAPVTRQPQPAAVETLVLPPPMPITKKTFQTRPWMVLSVMALIAAIVVVISRDPVNVSDTIAQAESDIPSLAVLPFENISADGTQDYLSTGLTADITTALASHSGLLVIAQPSVTDYKNSDTDVKNASRVLDVRYVLRGTVQSVDARFRVNAQLFDEQSGVQLWAERYDRALKDVFTVQDDIVGRIVNALAVKVTAEEKQRAARPYTTSIDAYDTFLRGQTYFSHRTHEDNQLARAAYEQAIKLDPNFARAYSALALTYSLDFRFGWSADSHHALQQALRFASQAVELDDALPQAYWVLGHVYLHQHQFDLARQNAQQAVRFNPNFADGYMALANAMINSEDAADALPLIRKAMRLNPRYPAQYAEILGQAYYFLGRHQDAIAALRDATERNANLLPSYIFLAASLVGTGDTDEARWTIEQARALMPTIQSNDVMEMFPIKSEQRMAMLVRDLERVGL